MALASTSCPRKDQVWQVEPITQRGLQLYQKTSVLSPELLAPSSQPLRSWRRGGLSQRQVKAPPCPQVLVLGGGGSRLHVPTQAPGPQSQP